MTGTFRTYLFRRIASDNTGARADNWDRCVEVSAFGIDEADAFAKAFTNSGPAPRGWTWKFRLIGGVQ